MSLRIRVKKACFLITGAALLLLALWFAMAEVDCSPETMHFPYRTGGWFLLGLVFTIPIAIGYAGLFLLTSRWLPLRYSWIAMLGVSVLLLVLGVRAALPRHQLRPVIGTPAAEAVSIEHLLIADSYNDGQTYAGVLSAQTDLLGLIREFRNLEIDQTQFPLVPFSNWFPNVALPVGGDVYSDEYGEFVTDKTGHRIYFWTKLPASRSNNGEPGAPPAASAQPVETSQVSEHLIPYRSAAVWLLFGSLGLTLLSFGAAFGLSMFPSMEHFSPRAMAAAKIFGILAIVSLVLGVLLTISALF